MTDQKLQQMFELTDKFLAPYHNGIAEGEQRERERIIELLQGMQETAFSTGTDKGKQTGWVLENAIVLIKEGNK